MHPFILFFRSKPLWIFNLKPIHNYLVKYYTFNNYKEFKCFLKVEVFRNFVANC